jgi:hypothetical protein
MSIAVTGKGGPTIINPAPNSIVATSFTANGTMEPNTTVTVVLKDSSGQSIPGTVTNNIIGGTWTASFSNIAPGSYTLIVTDSSGPRASEMITVQ